MGGRRRTWGGGGWGVAAGVLFMYWVRLFIIFFALFCSCKFRLLPPWSGGLGLGWDEPPRHGGVVNSSCLVQAPKGFTDHFL